MVVSVTVDDYFAVVNCSTPERVPHNKLDWYFETRASLKPPRVIWQRGRSNTARYTAYSPDQTRHYLQIKPVHHNDSGTYMCLDQTTGYFDTVELVVRKFHSLCRFACITHSLISICTREIFQILPHFPSLDSLLHFHK